VVPRVSVITGVGLDHTERLGQTVDEIAADKAQIIKAGSVAVLGPGTRDVDAVFEARASEVGAPIVRVAEEGAGAGTVQVRYTIRTRPAYPGDTLTIDVHTPSGSYQGLGLRAPSYQAQNVATAIAAAESLRGGGLDVAAMRGTLAAMTFPGRFELLASDPPLVLDGAHNPQAAAALAEAIAEAWPDQDRRPWCLLGVLADKDADGIIAALASAVGGFVATQPVSPRALDAGTLAAKIERVTGVWPEIAPALGPAIPYAMAQTSGAGLVITGSLYTAGQAKTALLTSGDAQPSGPRNRPKIVVDDATM
jgi:dihydrofolate synthase/folylpolyglutamate synthase